MVARSPGEQPGFETAQFFVSGTHTDRVASVRPYKKRNTINKTKSSYHAKIEVKATATTMPCREVVHWSAHPKKLTTGVMIGARVGHVPRSALHPVCFPYTT